jgi:hypothetical protein
LTPSDFDGHPNDPRLAIPYIDQDHPPPLDEDRQRWARGDYALKGWHDNLLASGRGLPPATPADRPRSAPATAVSNPDDFVEIIHICVVCGSDRAWFGKDGSWFCRAHSD